MKNVLYLLFLLHSANIYSQVIFNASSLDIEKFEIEGIELEKNYESQLDSLNNELELVKEEKLTIESLDQRIKLLEEKEQKSKDFMAESKINEVALVEKQYMAGIVVIKSMDDLTGAIVAQYTSIKLMQDYSNLVNPFEYSSFSNNIKEFTKETKKEFKLPDFNITSPVLSTVYSIAKSLVGKPKNKDSKVKEISCILDFTSKAAPDLRLIQFELEYLLDEAKKMEVNISELFKSYSAVVGYDKDINEYLLDIQDILESKLVPNYFEDIKNRDKVTTKEKLSGIRFEIDKVIKTYNDYNNFISNGSAYFAKFDKLLSDIKPDCLSSQEIKEDLTNRFDSVKESLDNAKVAYNNAYKNRIRQANIRKISLR